MSFAEHPQRRLLTDELHARPFTQLHAPAQILSLSFMPGGDAPAASAEAVAAHLRALLAHLDLPAPASLAGGAGHLMVDRPGLRVRWERHSEFSSLMLTREAAGAPLFTPDLLQGLPPGWLDGPLGPVIAAILVEVASAAEEVEAESLLREQLAPSFAQDALACAWVSNRQALAMSDFRIDPAGLTRFAVVAMPSIGPRRLGRLTQRLIEIENYRVMAMLALPLARAVGPRLNALGAELSEMIAEIPKADTIERERAALETLIDRAGEIERLSAETAFRFSAARAYEGIVNDRIGILREDRAFERQTFSEFMLRRFKPAMRTCSSVAERLDALAARAGRASDLLSTQVGVSLEAQNQALLRSMDRRARLQLRLQQTVEGLSVVAISYYAVSLAGYLLAPLAKASGHDVKVLMAVVAAPIIGVVWWFVRQLRRHSVDGAKGEPGDGE